MKRVAIFILLALSLLFVTRGVAPKGGGKQVFRVARDPSWHPFNVRGKDKNILAFTDELLKQVASEQQIRIDLVEAPWDALVPLLERGACDAVLTTVTPTQQLSDRFVLSEPVLLLGPVLIVQKGASARSLEDLAGLSLGVQSGTGLGFDLPKDSTIRIRHFDDMVRALDELVRGEVQGVIMESIRAEMVVGGFYKQQLTIATEPLNQAGVRMMTQPDERADLVETFDRALKDYKRSGVYNALIDKWKILK